MSKVVIDLSNYKDRVGTRVPEGRYRVQVEDVEETKAKSSGATMINVWFRVMGGEHDGATVIDRFPITENALFRLVGFMQAIGIPTPKKRISIDINKFTGKTLDIDVEDGEPYNGRVRSEVRGYLKAEKVAKSNDSDDLDLDDEEVDEEAPDAGEDVVEEQDDSNSEEEVEEAKPAKAKSKKKAEPAEAEDDNEFELEEIEL